MANPSMANMGLQASQRPTGYLPQGTVADVELGANDTLNDVPPPLVVNSFGRTLVQQNAFESTQVIETEFQGTTEQRKPGDVNHFKMAIESSDFISPSETYMKILVEWRVNEAVNAGTFGTNPSNEYQFACFEERLFPRGCTT